MLVTSRGHLYFLLLVVDLTRYMWVALLAKKGDMANSIHCIQVEVDEKCGRKLQVIHTDNNHEFTFDEFAHHCEELGVQHQFMASYSPQQSNVVKRGNHVVAAMTRAPLKQRKLLAEF